MGILNHTQRKEAEQLFKDYKKYKAKIEDIRINTILATPERISLNGNNSRGDTVGDIVVRIEKESKELQKRTSIVEATVSRYKGTLYGQLIDLLYLQNMPVSLVIACEELYISKQYAYECLTNVLTFAYMVGVQKGIFTV